MTLQEPALNEAAPANLMLAVLAQAIRDADDTPRDLTLRKWLDTAGRDIAEVLGLDYSLVDQWLQIGCKSIAEILVKGLEQQLEKNCGVRPLEAIDLLSDYMHHN